MLLAADFRAVRELELADLDVLRKVGCNMAVLRPVLGTSKLFQVWMDSSLLMLREEGFYVVVAFPLRWIPKVPPCDADVEEFVCGRHPEFRRSVWGVCFERRNLTVQDYLLRLAGLVRSGFTFGLITESLPGESGDYKTLVEGAAVAVRSQLGRQESVRKLCFVEESGYKLLWSAFRRDVLISVVDPEFMRYHPRWTRYCSRIAAEVS